MGVELLSTGGTAKFLSEKSIPVKEVSEHTGFPELFDGRVKTLHPKIHGGLLGRRGVDEHEAAMLAHDIEPIDLVIMVGGFALWAFLMYSAYQGKTTRLPVIGALAAKQAGI